MRRPPRMGEYGGRGLACRRGTRSLEWSSSEPAAEGDRGIVRPAWGHVIAEDHGAAFPLTAWGGQACHQRLIVPHSWPREHLERDQLDKRAGPSERPRHLHSLHQTPTVACFGQEVEIDTGRLARIGAGQGDRPDRVGTGDGHTKHDGAACRTRGRGMMRRRDLNIQLAWRSLR